MHILRGFSGISEVHWCVCVCLRALAVWRSWHLHLLKLRSCLCAFHVEPEWTTRLCSWCWHSFPPCSCHFLSNKLSECLIGPAGTVRLRALMSRMESACGFVQVFMRLYIERTFCHLQTRSTLIWIRIICKKTYFDSLTSFQHIYAAVFCRERFLSSRNKYLFCKRLLFIYFFTLLMWLAQWSDCHRLWLALSSRCKQEETWNSKLIDVCG